MDRGGVKMRSSYDYYKDSDTKGSCLGLILGAILAIGLIIFTIVYALNKDTVIATVTDKQVRGESGTYYVYTDEEVFVVKDSPFYFRWDSSDDWSLIEIGETYEFDVTGYRIPILSKYRNIIDYELVDDEDDNL